MAEWWEWTGEPGPWESNAAPDMYAGGSPTFTEGGGSTLPTTWEEYQRGGYAQLVPEALASRPDLYGPNAAADYLAQGGGYPTGGGDPGGSFWGSLGNLLLGAGGTAAGALGGGGGGGILGPLLSSLGSIGGGAIGSNAANDAARLQSEALNRGIDLQTAQWLQQQQNLAPYLQAGPGRAHTPAAGGPGAARRARGHAGRHQCRRAVPSATPGWTPRTIRDRRGRRRRLSLDARPGAAGAGLSLYAGAMPRPASTLGPQACGGTTAGSPARVHLPPTIATRQARRRTRRVSLHARGVPTLSGQELLANDPGVAFRMAEGRKALEASAAARGGLLSGPTLAALQRQGQDSAARNTARRGTGPPSRRRCARAGSSRRRSKTLGRP